MSSITTWIPGSVAPAALQRHVTGIYIACYKPEPRSNTNTITQMTKMTNHWTVFLTGPDSQSVRLDPTPNYERNMALMLLGTVKPYIVTSNAPRTVWLPFQETTTVAQILKEIEDNNLHRYQFSLGGIGCRYWVWSLIYKLKATGRMPYQAAFDEAVSSLTYVWEKEDRKVTEGQQSNFSDEPGTWY